MDRRFRVQPGRAAETVRAWEYAGETQAWESFVDAPKNVAPRKGLFLKVVRTVFLNLCAQVNGEKHAYCLSTMLTLLSVGNISAAQLFCAEHRASHGCDLHDRLESGLRPLSRPGGVDEGARHHGGHAAVPGRWRPE